MTNYILQPTGDVDSATADRVSKAALLAQPATYAIAFLDRNGVVAKIETFATYPAMTNRWDAMVDGDAIPPDIQQITWLDKTQRTNEGWNLAPNPSVSRLSFSKINWKSAAPYILGAGLLIAGAIYLSKNKKGSPGRRRARASFRRRTVTVWR